MKDLKVKALTQRSLKLLNMQKTWRIKTFTYSLVCKAPIWMKQNMMHEVCAHHHANIFNWEGKGLWKQKKRGEEEDGWMRCTHQVLQLGRNFGNVIHGAQHIGYWCEDWFSDNCHCGLAFIKCLHHPNNTWMPQPHHLCCILSQQIQKRFLHTPAVCLVFARQLFKIFLQQFFPQKATVFCIQLFKLFLQDFFQNPQFFIQLFKFFFKAFRVNLQFAFSSSLGFSSRASSKTNSFEFSSSSRFSSRLFQNLQFCIQLFFKLFFKALFKSLQKLSMPTTHWWSHKPHNKQICSSSSNLSLPLSKQVITHIPLELKQQAASSNQALSLSPPPNSRISRIDASASAAASFLLKCRTFFLIGRSRNRCTNPPTPQSKLTLKHHCGLGFQIRLSCPAPTHRPGNCAAGWLCSGAFQSRASTPGLVLRNPPALQAHNPAALWVLSPRALCCAPSSRSLLLQSQVLVWSSSCWEP